MTMPPVSSMHGTDDHRVVLVTRSGQTIEVILTADHKTVVVSGDRDSAAIPVESLATHPDETGYAADEVTYLRNGPLSPPTSGTETDVPSA